MAEGEKPCTLLTGKPEAKRPLGRPRRRWKCDIIKIFKMLVWRLLATILNILTTYIYEIHISLLSR